MSAGKIRVVMDLDDKGFHLKMERNRKVVKDFTRDLADAKKSIKNIEKGVTGFLPKLRDFAITASILKGGIHNLVNATLGWQMALSNNIGEVERMTFLLRGMSNAATDAGKSLEAAENLQFMLGMAEKAPFTLGEMTNSFVKFKSVGLDPLDGSLQSLTDAVAAFGGNDAILHRATVAIQQMAGKGVISMEELRQQLGEAVPNAIKLMAQSLGVTYQELVDRVSKGQVEAKSALAKMFGEFERTMGGSSERMMETWSGMLSRLRTRWLKFQLAIGESGYFEEAKKTLAELIDAFDENKIKGIAETIGQWLTGFLKGLKEVIHWLIKYREEISTVIKVIGGLFILKKVAALYAVFRAKLIAMNAVLVQNAYLMGRAKFGNDNFYYSSKRSMYMVGAYTTALRGLKTVMAALGGPIGIISAALVAGAGAWLSYGNTASDAVKKVRENLDEITDKDVQALDKRVQNLIKTRDQYAKNIADLQARKDAGESISQEAIDRNVDAWKKMNQIIEDAQGDHNLALEHISEQWGSKAEENLRRNLARELNVFRGYYKEQSDLAHDEFTKGMLEREDYNQIRLALAEQLYDDQKALMVKKAKELKSQLQGDNLSAKEVAELDAQIEYLMKQIKEVEKLRDKAMGEIEADPNWLPGTMAKGLLDMQKVISSNTGKAEDFKAEIAGLNGELAKFEYLVKAGKFGKLGEQFTQADLEKARKAIQLMYEQEQLLKREKQYRADVAQAQKQAVNLNHRLTQQLQNAKETFLADGNVNNSFVNQIKNQFAPLIAKVKEGTAAFKELVAERDKAFQAAIDTNMYQVAKKYKDDTLRIERSLMTEREAITDAYKQKVLDVHAEIVRAQGVSAEYRKEIEEGLYAHLAALQARYARDLETPMQKLNRDWQDTTKQMQDAIVNWANNATSAFVEFAKTGKLEFGSLIESILADLLKIQLQKDIFGPLFGSISSGIESLFGGGFKVDTGLTDAVGSFATGGIMTSKGKVPLNAYAGGGIANQPQMALFGEGSRPEAYVPLPDGKTIPVTMAGGMGNVQVNVINQSGTQVDAQQGEAKFDGKKMVLDVVLTAANTPGPFRDSLKGALK